MNEDVKIDYNTANIIFQVKIGKKKTEIFLPPASSVEIKKNALLLGEYSNCMLKVSPHVLIIDWDIYLEKCIKAIVNEELGFSSKSDIYDNKVKEYKDNIYALLDRSILGGYYFDIVENNIEIKSLKDIGEENKDIIRSQLLFFIVALRYTIPSLTENEAEKLLKDMKIKLTLLSHTDYKNTITIQSKGKESLKK